MPGIHDTTKIDLITRTKEGSAHLIIVEEQPWTGEEKQITAFLEKINTYLIYALGTQFKEMYPDLAAQPVHIKVMAFHEFDGITKKMFDHLQNDVKKRYAIDISFQLMEKKK